MPLVIPPDASPNVPVKLRGWYIKGDGVSENDTDDTQNAGNDKRNMWPSTIRIIDAVRPRFVFLENVPGLLSAGQLLVAHSSGANVSAVVSGIETSTA